MDDDEKVGKDVSEELDEGERAVSGEHVGKHEESFRIGSRWLECRRSVYKRI